MHTAIASAIKYYCTAADRRRFRPATV